MPTISRVLIRTSAAYLAAAALLGILTAVPVAGVNMLPAGLEPAQLHLLVVGWITQLIFGVALWMFPRYGDRGAVSISPAAWGAYAALNAGLLLRLAAEPWLAVRPDSVGARAMLAVSAASQWGAVMYFALRLWKRTAAERG